MTQATTPETTKVDTLNKETPPETFQTPVPDSKRTALLRYMIIMFAVAFVLVLLSMVLQVRSSHSTISELHQSSTSALTKAKQLQDTNRDLQDQIKELQKQLTASETALAETQSQLADAKNGLTATKEQLTTANAQLDNAWKSNAVLTAEKENLKVVYTALSRVLMGPSGEGDVEYSRALDTLEKMKQHLDPAVASLYEAWREIHLNISE